VQRVLHLIELERLDDCLDLFHRLTSPRGLGTLPVISRFARSVPRPIPPAA
jgi:hypothetical protein